MKQCPFCAEDIQNAAIVCRYCKRDLASQDVQSMMADETTGESAIMQDVKAQLRRSLNRLYEDAGRIKKVLDSLETEKPQSKPESLANVKVVTHPQKHHKLNEEQRAALSKSMKKVWADRKVRWGK